jgi:hypothetical protein
MKTIAHHVVVAVTPRIHHGGGKELVGAFEARFASGAARKHPPLPLARQPHAHPGHGPLDTAVLVAGATEVAARNKKVTI